MPEAILASEGECPESQYLQNEMRWKMNKAMATLPELQRRIIWLHFFHGYSYQHIAEECKLSKSTIRDYVKRGLIQLRQYLTKEKMVV